jgi:hypothetical protein
MTSVFSVTVMPVYSSEQKIAEYPAFILPLSCSL